MYYCYSCNINTPEIEKEHTQDFTKKYDNHYTVGRISNNVEADKIKKLF